MSRQRCVLMPWTLPRSSVSSCRFELPPLATRLQVRQMNLLGDLGQVHAVMTVKYCALAHAVERTPMPTSQVTHVFSDKTGTLTSNHMEFRRCGEGVAPAMTLRDECMTSLRAFSLSAVIDNLQYGCGDTAISRSVYGDSPPVPKRQTPLPRWAGCQPWTAPYVGYEEAADVHSMFEDIAQETLVQREDPSTLLLHHSARRAQCISDRLCPL